MSEVSVALIDGEARMMGEGKERADLSVDRPLALASKGNCGRRGDDDRALRALSRQNGPVIAVVFGNSGQMAARVSGDVFGENAQNVTGDEPGGVVRIEDVADAVAAERQKAAARRRERVVHEGL